MAINKFPAESKDSFIPAGAAGSYTTSRTLSPGVYVIETDTTQNISASNFYAESPEGFRFNAPVTGGRAYLTVPTESNVINISSGAFPLPVNLEKSNYRLSPPPSASYTEYVPGEIFITVDLPSDSSGFNLYWGDGTSACVSGSAASVTVPESLMESPPIINGIELGIGSRDSNNTLGILNSITLSGTYEYINPPSGITADFYAAGAAYLSASTNAASFVVLWDNGSASTTVSGSAASITIPYTPDFASDVLIDSYAIDSLGYPGSSSSYNLGNYPWIEFLSSSTFTPPPGVTSGDVYVLAGGGTHASASVSTSAATGGGGGGETVFVPAVPFSGPVTVTVGAGGSSGGGTPSSFGPAIVANGGGGTTISSFTPGGISGSGNPGGSGSSFAQGGGGGGDSANGNNATPTSGGAGGAGNTNLFSVPVGGGGGGGVSSTPLTAGVGVDGGGNGAKVPNSPGQRAAAGGAGAVNRGGGSGGGAAFRTSPGPWPLLSSSTGGSGRVAVKALF